MDVYPHEVGTCDNDCDINHVIANVLFPDQSINVMRRMVNRAKWMKVVSHLPRHKITKGCACVSQVTHAKVDCKYDNGGCTGCLEFWRE